MSHCITTIFSNNRSSVTANMKVIELPAGNCGDLRGTLHPAGLGHHHGAFSHQLSGQKQVDFGLDLPGGDSGP